MKLLQIVVIILAALSMQAQVLKDCQHPCEKTRTIKYGAFIGVKISDIPNSKYVQVIEIIPNSAAYTFGIKINDTISHINDIEMKNTIHLLSEIAKQQPGNEVSVSIKRASSNLEFNFPLGAQFSKTITEIECCDTMQIIDDIDIALSPNSVSDYLLLQSSKHIDGEIIIDITDNKGTKIHTEKSIGNTGAFFLKLDTRNFKKGNYFLKMDVGKSQYVKRFTKL
jgi:membrane-associated protease RseP (regulator of RpoE activity)